MEKEHALAEQIEHEVRERDIETGDKIRALERNERNIEFEIDLISSHEACERAKRYRMSSGIGNARVENLVTGEQTRGAQMHTKL